jgi:C4-dicarboxylate-specific signal transduction histidine kinase
VIREALAFAAVDARHSGVELQSQLQAGLPTVYIDRIQVQQVVLNLIRNSIEALQTAPLQNRKVWVRTGIERGGLFVRVADNGPGVPDDLHEKMFDAFCTTKETGTGLGLAISRTIAEAHQGTLRYEPNLPRGACFRLELPTRGS